VIVIVSLAPHPDAFDCAVSVNDVPETVAIVSFAGRQPRLSVTPSPGMTAAFSVPHEVTDVDELVVVQEGVWLTATGVPKTVVDSGMSPPLAAVCTPTNVPEEIPLGNVGTPSVVVPVVIAPVV
jgi:hypothetical protein